MIFGMNIMMIETSTRWWPPMPGGTCIAPIYYQLLIQMIVWSVNNNANLLNCHLMYCNYIVTMYVLNWDYNPTNRTGVCTTVCVAHMIVNYKHDVRLYGIWYLLPLKLVMWSHKCSWIGDISVWFLGMAYDVIHNLVYESGDILVDIIWL